MTRKALGEPLVGSFICDCAGNEGVVPHDLLAGQSDVGLGRFGLLVLIGIANEKPVQRFAPAIEFLDSMAALQLLNSQRGHYMPPRSNTLGSLRSLARRRDGRGGASSAF